jgi:hypothetical protein
MQPICLEYCYQKLLIEKCNCTDATAITIDDGKLPCYTDEQIDCLDNVYYELYLNTSYITETCIPLCPLECNFTDFQPSLYSTRLNSLYFDTVFNSSTGPKYGNISFDNDDVENCFIQLNIYYKTLGYSASYESPLVDIVTLFWSDKFIMWSKLAEHFRNY